MSIGLVDETNLLWFCNNGMYFKIYKNCCFIIKEEQIKKYLYHLRINEIKEEQIKKYLHHLRINKIKEEQI